MTPSDGDCRFTWRQRAPQIGHPEHHECMREPGHKGMHRCHCLMKCQYPELGWEHGAEPSPTMHLGPAPKPKPPKRPRLPKPGIVKTDEALPGRAYDHREPDGNAFLHRTVCRDPWERKCTETKIFSQGLCASHFQKAVQERKARK